MEKKSKLLISGIIIFILVIVAIKIYEHHRDKNINSFIFPETLKVNNYTNHKGADTLVLVILDKIFQLDTVNVNIIYTPDKFDSSDFQLIAMITKEKYGLHNYTLFVKKNKYFDVKECICHEMIHVDQMEQGDLIQIDNTKVVYKGDTIYFSETDYNDRDYEKEAFKETRNIKKQLNKLLYR
jgi:hypothetical protein